MFFQDGSFSKGIIARAMIVIGVYIAVSAVLILLAHAGPSAIPPGASPEIQAWYGKQHNSRGEWCCNESDGHPFYGDYSINEDGSVSVEFDGAPHLIAAELVLKGKNPTGHAVWW